MKPALLRSPQGTRLRVLRSLAFWASLVAHRLGLALTLELHAAAWTLCGPWVQWCIGEQYTTNAQDNAWVDCTECLGQCLGGLNSQAAFSQGVEAFEMNV